MLLTVREIHVHPACIRLLADGLLGSYTVPYEGTLEQVIDTFPSAVVYPVDVSGRRVAIS